MNTSEKEQSNSRKITPCENTIIVISGIILIPLAIWILIIIRYKIKYE